MKLDKLMNFFLEEMFINENKKLKVDVLKQNEKPEDIIYSRTEDILKTVDLSEDDIVEFIKKMADKKNTKISNFRIGPNEAEMLINSEILRPYRLYGQSIFEVNNPLDNITYNIGNISVEYFIDLLLSDSIREQDFRYIIRRVLPFYIRRKGKIDIDEKGISLNAANNEVKFSIIHKIFEKYVTNHYMVLKIKFKDKMNLIKCKQHFLSYIFDLNLEGIKVRPSENAEDFFNVRNLNTKSYRNLSSELKTPYKKYSEDLIHLYSNAVWSDNPFTKYIMFYQILERFFTKIPEERMINFVRDRFMNPKISFKDNKQILDLCIAIGDKQKNTKKEQQQLLEVLRQFLPDFNGIVADLNSDQICYYKEEIPSFIKSSDHKILVDLNTTNIKDTIVPLAHRIYIVRNALVHNKGNRDNNYDPTRDYSNLMKEVPLIKAIAEEIMIKDAKEL